MASGSFMTSALLAHAVALDSSDHRDTLERLVILEQLCCEGNEIAVFAAVSAGAHGPIGKLGETRN
jgi:hypothetical protein